MVIDEIKNRIENSYSEEDLKGYSPFILSECIKHDGSDREITEILPVESCCESFEVGDNLVLTDRKGNELLNGYTSNHTTVLSVDGNRLLVQKMKEKSIKIGSYFELDKVTLYEYNGERIVPIQELYDGRYHRTFKVTKPCEKSSNVLIEKTINGKKQAYLYSLSQKKRITPLFRTLEVVRDTDGKLLKFTDEVESNEILDGKTLKSGIIGFITIDGEMKNVILDERTNEVKDVELNTHPDFMQYRSFKNYISRDLDDDIEKEVAKRRKRETSIKNLELKLKTTNK